MHELILLIESLPRNPHELTQEWRAAHPSFFMECLEKAYNAHGRERTCVLFNYFIAYFPQRHFTAQRMLTESVIGVFAALSSFIDDNPDLRSDHADQSS